MQTAVSSLLGVLADRLSTLSPFAKAIVPSAAGLVGALVNMAFAGRFNVTSIVVLGVGVASALVVYLVPNRAATPAPAPVAPAPAPAPVTPAAPAKPAAK